MVRAVCTEDIGSAYKSLVGNPQERDSLEDSHVEE
jgi:hypothetical protein